MGVIVTIWKFEDWSSFLVKFCWAKGEAIFFIVTWGVTNMEKILLFLELAQDQFFQMFISPFHLFTQGYGVPRLFLIVGHHEACASAVLPWNVVFQICMPFSMALCLCSFTFNLGFRFAPGLSCITYAGDKEERAHLQQDLKQKSHFHVLLTTYEVSICFSIAKPLNLGP